MTVGNVRPGQGVVWSRRMRGEGTWALPLPASVRGLLPRPGVYLELFLPFAKECLTLKMSLSLGSHFSNLLHPVSVAGLGWVAQAHPQLSDSR